MTATRRRAVLDLPRPDCRLGYPWHQVKAILQSAKLDEHAFQEWFRGQTGAICEGMVYDEKGDRVIGTCGPHGMVVYASDLWRFLEGLPDAEFVDVNTDWRLRLDDTHE
jgi:hypothetical protein